jgi:hypothetical protein
MNMSRTAARAIITIACIASQTLCFAAKKMEEPAYVLLSNVNNNSCRLAAPAEGSGEVKTYNLALASNHCRYAIRSMELYAIPSSTRILITENLDCNKQAVDMPGFRYWLELKTAHKATSVSSIEIQALIKYEPLQMIRPGLQLIDYKHIGNGDVLRDTMGCIRLTASTYYVPPTPASQPATPSR